MSLGFGGGTTGIGKPRPGNVPKAYVSTTVYSEVNEDVDPIELAQAFGALRFAADEALKVDPMGVPRIHRRNYERVRTLGTSRQFHLELQFEVSDLDCLIGGRIFADRLVAVRSAMYKAVELALLPVMRATSKRSERERAP